MALSKGFVTTAATTALDGRLLEQSLLVRNVGDVPRAGVLYGAINPLSGTSSMNITIADQVVLAVTRGNTDGVNIVTNVGAATVTLSAAPSSNARYDVVYVKHNDTEKGDANSVPVFDKVTGTAAASPVVPSVPAGALVLGTVLVPAGAASTNATGVVISNSVPSTALAGGPIRYRTFAEMLSDAATVVEGTTAYIKGGGYYYLRAGAWRRADAMNFAIASVIGAPLASGTSVTTLSATPGGYQSSDTQFFDVRTDAVFLVKQPGWYEVTANVSWSNNSTGERYIEIMQGDSSVTPQAADRRAASGTTNQSVTGHIYFNAGDFIKLKGYQNSGSQINYSSRLVVKAMTV